MIAPESIDWRSLPAIPLSHRDDLPEVPGVYVVFVVLESFPPFEKRMIFVEKTKNVRAEFVGRVFDSFPDSSAIWVAWIEIDTKAGQQRIKEAWQQAID